MVRRSGLGRGLGALIPGVDEKEVVVDLTDNPFQEVPISSISANTFQPRKHIDTDALEPLAASIKELGVLQPILVRKQSEGRFELIAGERRWRAARQAGLRKIPVIVRNAENSDSLEQALVENLHRKDLNSLDEAAAYRQLIDDFSMTHEQVGKRVGKSRTAVTNLLRLLQLPPRVQKLLVEERLSEGHARALLGTDDESFQIQLAERVVKDDLSVRAVEDAVRLRNELEKPQTKKRSIKNAATGVPAILEVQDRLIDRLDTRVQILGAGKRGQIKIHFADLDDLDRISQLITSSDNLASSD